MQQTAIVTGGLSGIGRAIVMQLKARGDFVVVFDKAVNQPHAMHDGVLQVHVDIASLTSIKNAFTYVDSFLAEHSHAPLSIFVNNAGITQDALAIRMREDAWDSVLDINLKGSFLCAQQALMRLSKQPVSYLIFTSSIVGLRGNAGQANYAASKAGVIGLAKSLAREYAARNVLVNALAPGFIQTPMTEKLTAVQKEAILQLIPLCRFGTPDDVAACVAFLSSGKANYITGQVIEIAGGM